MLVAGLVSFELGAVPIVAAVGVVAVNDELAMEETA